MNVPVAPTLNELQRAYDAACGRYLRSVFGFADVLTIKAAADDVMFTGAALRAAYHKMGKIFEVVR